MPTFLRRTLYVLLGLIGLVLVLLIVAVVALQFPATQDFVARKAEGYLRDKLGTEVRIGKFRTDFRHAINLDGVYLEDQQRDTLLSVGHLGVDIDIWALTKSQINVSNVELNDGRVRLTRTAPDSVNNYDFIIAAFTDPTAPVDTTSAGFKYDIGKARLTNIYFTQLDEITGSDIRARIGEFAAEMDEVDVDKSVYKVDNATLRRTSIAMRQTKTAPEVENPGPTEPLTVQFGLNRATLEQVAFTYKNDPAAQYIGTTIGQAEVTAKNIDLQRQRVDLGKLLLKNTTFAYAQNEQVPVEQRVVNPAEAVRKLDEATDKVQAANPAVATPGWRVTLEQSDISGVDVKFDNFNQPRQKTRIPALDYNHLHFSDLVLNTRNLSYSENRTTGRVDQLAGREQSGFRVDKWQADVVYDSVQIRLDSLDLITPHTRIRRTLAIGFDSLGALADVKQLAKMKIEGDLREVRIGFRDILYLAPDLAGTPPFNTGPNQSVLLNGQVAGRVGDMTIRNFEFVGLRSTVLKARRAHITGLPETDGRLYVDADIQQFRTTREDINSLVPKGTIPSNISIPPSIALRGTFKGRPTTLQFNTDLTVNTTYGDVAFSGDLGPANAAGRQPLVGTFAVRGFDAGKLLKDPTIGKITASGRMNLTGNLQDPNTLVGRVNANVQSARYNNYTYKGVVATVDLDRNRYVINAQSKQDPNLNLDLNAVVNLRDPNNPTYEVRNLNLRGANLTALGFYTGGDLRVQGDLTANLRGASANTLNGTFAGRKIVIVKDNQPFALDSVDGRIVQTNSRTLLEVNSNVADVNLDGNVHLGDLATELQQHIDRYFALDGVDYRKVNMNLDRHFSYSLKVKDTKLVTKLVPDLKELSPFTLAGDYSRQDARLTAQTSIPVIRYANYRVDSLKLDVGSNPQQLNYALRLAQASQDTTLRLRRPSIVGNVADNKLFTRVAILGDSANRERLALAGTLSQEPDRAGTVYQFAMASEQVINYENWTAGPNNYLRYYPGGEIVADGLNLTNGRSTLAVQSQNPAVRTSPLGVRFEKFDLAELAKAVQQQDSLVAGVLNGTAELRNLGKPTMAFTANATVTGLAFQKALIGDIAVQATNPSPNRYDVDARLTGGAAGSAGGQGNDVQVNGFYQADNQTSPLNLTVDARRLNLALAEAFAAGQLTRSAGYATGRLTVQGTPGAPAVRGTIRTSDDAAFAVTQLGALYRLPGQELTFDERGIEFDDFTVRDSADNKAVVNGYLLTKDFINYAFDMTATTKNFVAVNNTRKQNELFYGRVIVDSDTRLTGPLELLKINTTVNVDEGSRLTIESPSADPSKQDTEGIVQWIDKSAPLDTMLARRLAADTTKVNATGYDITAVVTVNDKVPFTIVIDPASGDNLRVRANGTLNTYIDPSGNITLSGRLEVARGVYKLSLYDLASREFIIRRGSSITWSGDPYNADLNITAVYRVEAAPADLLASQGSSNPEINTVARNRLPFSVLLKVTDQLSKPAIGFDITLPENQRGALGGEVETRLAQLRQPSQTSEMSKQVFSLLILGRFLQDNPFQSSAGEGFVATQLRGSASQVLTDQLQNLTGKYLAGLGLDLGVTNQADYSSGAAKSRTDLNVAVRRQFLNNRLSVRLGTDIPLSGNNGTQATQGANAASNFAGDVSIEYTILRDGRLRLRAFRQNAYEDIDGQLVKTGAALVFQRDYQDLKDLFAKLPPDIKEERKANRKQEKADKKAAKDSVQAAPTTRVDSSKVK